MCGCINPKPQPVKQLPLKNNDVKSEMTGEFIVASAKSDTPSTSMTQAISVDPGIVITKRDSQISAPGSGVSGFRASFDHEKHLSKDGDKGEIYPALMVSGTAENEDI